MPRGYMVPGRIPCREATILFTELTTNWINSYVKNKLVLVLNELSTIP
jgi:hypothetical protein